MNRFTSLARTAIFATTLLGATAALADPMPFTSFLTTTDPYQNGRLSRNGIPQDFAGDEAYPGYNAATIGSLYHYEVFSINVGAANYISISFDNTSSLSTLNSFIAAYQSAYYVTNYGTSWLGDVGSAAPFTNDPGYMDFVATPYSTVVLVVNAGVAMMGDPLELDADEVDRMIRINVQAPYHAAVEAARQMQEGGRIIVIGSNVGDHVGFPGIAAYTLTKAAVQGLVRGLARDFGPRGITVNAVQPGPVDTDMNPADGPLKDTLYGLMALRRHGRPEEIAGLVAWLAGPEAGFATGAMHTIDGGFNA